MKRRKKVTPLLLLSGMILLILTIVTLSTSTNEKIQQERFKSFGNTAHAEFFHLTSTQVQELKKDPRIKEYGLQLMVAQTNDAPFDKQPLEISCCDTNVIQWSTLSTAAGALPTENTREAMADTATLKKLKVKQKLGETFTLTLKENGKATQESFQLSGWWSAKKQNSYHLLLPQSRKKDLMKGTKKENSSSYWNMEVRFSSSLFLQHKVNKLLAAHGYQTGNKNKDNYIRLRINLGYGF